MRLTYCPVFCCNSTLHIEDNCTRYKRALVRLNGSLRDELLNAYVFKNLRQVRERIEIWVEDYNQKRPHESLGNRTPKQVYEEFT